MCYFCFVHCVCSVVKKNDLIRNELCYPINSSSKRSFVVAIVVVVALNWSWTEYYNKLWPMNTFIICYFFTDLSKYQISESAILLQISIWNYMGRVFFLYMLFHYMYTSNIPQFNGQANNIAPLCVAFSVVAGTICIFKKIAHLFHSVDCHNCNFS